MGEGEGEGGVVGAEVGWTEDLPLVVEHVVDWSELELEWVFAGFPDESREVDGQRVLEIEE